MKDPAFNSLECIILKHHLIFLPLTPNYFFLFVFLSFTSILDVPAQTNDSAIRTAAISNAILQYKSFAKPPTALYNGKQYVDYVHTLNEGQPFFMSSKYVKGKLMYDHILYEDLPLRYDFVLNELITSDPTQFFDLVLFDDKINYFQIHDHTFIPIVKDSSSHSLKTGFYNRLYHGSSVTLLKKEERKILTSVTERDGVRNVIDEKKDFYMSVDKDFYRTNNKNAVLDVLKLKRDALKTFIRKNKLRFSKLEIDDTLIKIAEYYQSLTQ